MYYSICTSHIAGLQWFESRQPSNTVQRQQRTPSCRLLFEVLNNCMYPLQYIMGFESSLELNMHIAHIIFLFFKLYFPLCQMLFNWLAWIMFICFPEVHLKIKLCFQNLSGWLFPFPLNCEWPFFGAVKGIIPLYF